MKTLICQQPGVMEYDRREMPKRHAVTANLQDPAENQN